jgi:Tfp pilus assembly protein PilO
MNVNFDIKALAGRIRGNRKDLQKDPRVVMRVILGLLLVANVAAALALARPWAASPEELLQRLGQLKSQVEQKNAAVARLETLVEKSRQARDEGDSFMDQYFMDRRTASSTIIAELKDSASEAGVKQEDHTFGFEPIEGSDNLDMMTISGNYQGKYEDLVSFINLIDRSPRFLILDTLTASPERTAGGLSMNFKMNAFVINGKRLPPVEESGEASPTGEPPVEPQSESADSGDNEKKGAEAGETPSEAEPAPPAPEATAE